MPKTGEQYKHFKGGTYTIITLAKDCDDPSRELVVYKNNENGNIWVRALAQFTDHIDRPELNYNGPRFTLLN